MTVTEACPPVGSAPREKLLVGKGPERQHSEYFHFLKVNTPAACNMAKWL